MVMISTVGYGDIYPYTSGGRATVSLVILVAMVFVPRETNELLEMIMQSSKYQRARYLPPKSKRALHIIVSGNMSSCSEIELFTELFHEDHDAQDLHAVVLQPEAPSFGMDTPAASTTRNALHTSRVSLPGVRSEACEGHLRSLDFHVDEQVLRQS